MTNSQRTPAQRAADTISVFEQFRDQLTKEDARNILTEMTTRMATEASLAGDVQAYANLVQSSLSLARYIGANDRAAMLAAAIVTQSGVVRPQLELVDEE